MALKSTEIIGKRLKTAPGRYIERMQEAGSGELPGWMYAVMATTGGVGMYLGSQRSQSLGTLAGSGLLGALAPILIINTVAEIWNTVGDVTRYTAPDSIWFTEDGREGKTIEDYTPTTI